MGKPCTFHHGCQGNPTTERAISLTQEFVPIYFFEEFLFSIAIVVDDFVHRNKPIRLGKHAVRDYFSPILCLIRRLTPRSPGIFVIGGSVRFDAREKFYFGWQIQHPR